MKAVFDPKPGELGSRRTSQEKEAGASGGKQGSQAEQRSESK